MPLFATSWLLTLYSHDVEHFDSLQRMFDLFISRGPKTFIFSTIEATIYASKSSLKEYYIETEDMTTAPYIVFKSPLRSFNTISVVEGVL
jgi:hypothetical protein